MVEYLPLFALFVLATLFAGVSFMVSGLVSPKRASAAKSAPYECGIVPTSEPAERFPVRFYLIAMIFIIFDIEIIFLYPWAVHFDALGLFGLVEMVVFSVAVVVSLAYLISNGALDWGPGRRNDDARTTDSTIRRVHRPAYVAPAMEAPVAQPAVATDAPE